MTEAQLTIAILALLFAKHFIADFVLQFDYMVQQKGIYGAEGGVHHTLMHIVGTWAVLCWMTNPFIAVFAALADGLFHYHIDWLKMNINRWRGLTIQDHEFWVWLGADQLAHSLTYLAITLWAVSHLTS
jgi:hypothetical protein